MSCTVVVTTKTGQKLAVTNPMGWENFLLNFVLMRAIVGVGIYIPMEQIDNIAAPQPTENGAIQPQTMADVIRLVPQPTKPEGAA